MRTVISRGLNRTIRYCFHRAGEDGEIETVPVWDSTDCRRYYFSYIKLYVRKSTNDMDDTRCSIQGTGSLYILVYLWRLEIHVNGKNVCQGNEWRYDMKGVDLFGAVNSITWLHKLHPQSFFETCTTKRLQVRVLES